ncbi:MAG: hypothetical protein N2Z58_03165 [Fervidobacterium sp.]|nr:hypothetical protein [Fervidobacterium sp.]
MRKLFTFISILLVFIFVSSCGTFSNNNKPAESNYRTEVNIIDPYGNKLFIEGNINDNVIKADKNGVYINAKIESPSVNVVFSETLSVFKIKDIFVEPNKSVTITLERSVEKGIQLLRTSNGYLRLYVYGYKNTPYVSIWLKNKLSTFTYMRLNNNQMVLAGNWLIAVVPPDKNKISPVGQDEIVEELKIPTSTKPEISRIEINNFK